jgi:FlaA1/EpsC-like NDP-sugar epimerase
MGRGLKMHRFFLGIKKKMWQVPQIIFISALIFIIMTVFIWLTLEDAEILIRYSELITHFVFLCVCMVVYKLISRIYGTLLNYGETRKFELILLLASFGFAAFTILSTIFDFHFMLPYKVISVSLFLLTVYLLFICFYRLVLRKRAKKISNKLKRSYKHIAIIGAGDAGKKLFDEIRENTDTKYRVWCFLDDDNKIIGRKIDGVSIKGPINSIENILKESPVSEVILAIPTLNDGRRQEILDLCPICRTL